MFTEIHHTELDSTHRYAERERDQLLPGSFVITADHQTAGIGTKEGRTWNAKPGKSLLATFLFETKSKLPQQNFSQLLAHAVNEALEMLEFKPTFKWPNDILLSNKKVGGAMTTIHGNTIIASIGLNVTMTEEDFGEVDYPATSLQLESSSEIDIDLIEQLVITVFGKFLQVFEKDGFDPFIEQFENHLAFMNEEVMIDDVQGVVKGLESDGRLKLLVSGEEIKVSTGTLRPL